MSNVFGVNVQKDDFGQVDRTKILEVFEKLMAGLSGQTCKIREEDQNDHIRIVVEFTP